MTRRLAGVIPVAPTAFADDGALDLASQRRMTDFLVDAGSDAICILANWSEQFALADDERDAIADAVLDHAAGRVPIVVTTSHFATRIAVERARRAEAAGAAALMIMAPYHGATVRVREPAVFAFFTEVAVRDRHPDRRAGRPHGRSRPVGRRCSCEWRARSRTCATSSSRTPTRPTRSEPCSPARATRSTGRGTARSRITLIADLEAGATGTMPGAVIPEVLGDVMRRWAAGDRDGATALFERWLPLLNWENKHAGLAAAKILMHEGGIIAVAAVRAPLAPGLAGTARRVCPPRAPPRSADPSLGLRSSRRRQRA